MVLKNSESGGYYVTQRQWTPTKPRAPIAADFQTPGPGSFNLPTTIGKNANQAVKGNSPSYTFGSKIDEKRPNPVPGPGSYNIAGLSEKGKDSCAAPTIAAKLKEPEPFKTPAPGAYNPDKSDVVTHNAAPRYTFGSKHKDHNPDDIPAPAYYNPERGDGAVYSRTPGFTIRGRSYSPHHEEYPSPADYAPERADSLRYASPPRYSFGSRYRDHEDDYPPAPNEYRIERADNLRYRSPPRWSFRSRTKHEVPPDGPPPNSYHVETSDRQRYPSPPKFSIRGNRNLRESYDKENVPGPGHYQPSIYGTIPRAANLSNKLEPKRHLRYLKRNDEDPPRRFKFIDDPVDEPVKKKRSEAKKSWFPSFVSAQRKQTTEKSSKKQPRPPLEPKKNAAEENLRSNDTKAHTPPEKDRAARLSWTSPLRPRQKKKETKSVSTKTSSYSERPQNPSSTAAPPSTRTSRPLSWVGGDDRASRASEKAQPSLRRSLSFGPTSKSSKERDLDDRRGRSVESLRMPPRFESYALPTKSYSQKIASSSFGSFERWPSLRRIRDSTPAPGEYHPERADCLVYRSAPKFSFRSKTADPDVIFNERFFNTYP